MRELSLHILDILQNSAEAGASCIELDIDEDLQADRLSVCVKDNGRGMDATLLARVTDPFFTTRTTRHVGLGLPLLRAAAERCNGNLRIESQPGVGTTVAAGFQRNHIDRAPLGNIRDTLMAFILGQNAEGAVDLRYRHRVGDGRFEFDTAELRQELDGIEFAHPRVRQWLEEFIAEGEADLYNGSPGGDQNAEDQVD